MCNGVLHVYVVAQGKPESPVVVLARKQIVRVLVSTPIVAQCESLAWKQKSLYTM